MFKIFQSFNVQNFTLSFTYWVFLRQVHVQLASVFLFHQKIVNWKVCMFWSKNSRKQSVCFPNFSPVLYCVEAAICRFSAGGDTAEYSRIQWYNNTKIQGYSNTGIQQYRDTGIQQYRDTAQQAFGQIGCFELSADCRFSSREEKNLFHGFNLPLTLFRIKNYLSIEKLIWVRYIFNPSSYIETMWIQFCPNLSCLEKTFEKRSLN